jgi:hypothetical protein
MSAWPEAASVEQFLVRVRRRLVVRRAIEGAAIGFLLAAVLVIAGLRSWILLTSVVTGSAALALLAFVRHLTLAEVAKKLEHRTNRPRNLVVTASELLGGTRSYVHDAVMSRASRIVAELDINALFPARRATSMLVLAAVAFAVVVMRPEGALKVVQVLPFAASGPAVQRVQVTVIPPAYSALAQSTATNPTRIEALAGSRIQVRIEANAFAVALETLAGTSEAKKENGVYTATFNATSDGFLAIEPRDSSGRAGARRFIGLSVTSDAPPRVTLTSPGRDLFFATVPDTLPVSIKAEDDLALASVHLKYTAVSGSGERFTFTEREVPLTVSRPSPGAWTGRGTWRLDQLGLTPGDMVVYRAVATDKRPGAPPVESDSYVLEVVTPGAIAAEGFAADDHRDRYAVSQQMVILKTERLIARRGSLKTDSLDYESRSIAAEQRQVRAEFVFMMGGELEDIAGEAAGTLDLNEVAEAEAEGDLLAGRQQNRGRVEMMRAIRAMSRASASLTETNLDQALRDERAALDNLMSAFSRSRFILRALTQRERIDLERRLSGSLNLTAGLTGPAAESSPDARIVALRRLLADVAAGDSVAIKASAMAVLREDPGSLLVQRLAARAQELAGRGPGVGMETDSLVNQLTSLIAGSLPVSPALVAPRDAGLLEAALREARREARRP